MKKYILVLISVLVSGISTSFADSLPAFPMTIYGTISGAWVGTKLSFYDGNNSLLTTFITTREWWYGYDSTIAGTSPIFSGFTGALRMSVEYQGKIYTISSITSSTIGCPASNNITFISNVCRYDIVAVAPVIKNTPSGWWGGGGGGWGSLSSSSTASQTTTVTTNTGVTQSGVTQSGIVFPIATEITTPKVINELTSKNPIIVSPQELKKSKVVTLETTFKKGTNLVIYRVLPNWRKIQAWKTRVLPNGKIRFTTKIAGKYILVQK